ncbi:MAG: TatD family hydrolase, partial [Nanoarchaeota archaeon]
ITQGEIDKITNQEIGKATESEVDRLTKEITEREIARITEERTKAITDQILGGGTTDKGLKEVACDNAPTKRQFASSQYYTGPLIDSHLHMPFTFDVPKALYAQADYDGAVLEKDVAAGSIMCVFDKTGVQSAIGFYVIPSLLKGQAVVQIKQIEEKFSGRITPFIMPAHVSALNVQPADVESVLKANPGLFKGIGEIAMYKPAYKGTSPDDISFRAFYDIAASHGLTVMIHLDNGQREAIEKILQDYPGVNFLFHGHEMRSYVAEIVAKYPNAYYSIDGDLNDIPDEHESANLYGDKTKEEFVVKFKRDYETILATAITNWKGPIEKNPTKFLWGT